MVPELKSFALRDHGTGEILTTSAADIIIAAMQVDAYADVVNNIWYRIVPENRVNDFLTDAAFGYTVYHAPNGWSPCSDSDVSLRELLSFPVAGHVEVMWSE